MLSINAYIKRHCQDAWDGPTGSFTGNNRTSVLAFGEGPVSCRVSKLKCKGAVRCSFGDPDLLKDHAHYESNYHDTKDLIIVPTQEMNARAGCLPSSTLEFYRLVMSLPCPYEDEFGRCEGTPVMRKRSKGRSGNSSTPQRDTKEYFIGCSHWTTHARSEDQEGKMSHTYHHIRREAREDLLLQLFSGELDQSDSSLHESLESSCGILLHPAHKFRDGKCVYPHSEDGEVKEGILKAHTCAARLTIYVPEDGLRAIIIPQAEQPHSHPAFPRSKVTYAAEEQYRELWCLVDSTDLSPSKLPHVIHPGLNNKRKKRDLVYDERQRAFPNGLGIGAVMQLFEAERKLPLQDRYIFAASTTSDNAFVIVTLNPELAQYLHATEFVQVDTTFKRVYGDYNEWKVVVWFCRLNTSK
ncbi:hypothetical protein M407DRAFT_8592 [Tulasnella calospora MUT 4182]|uniref:Uncharacterized protein n=1 Tax=Tulasnella calospora MUT 4182 TaxID=1051891 RepID=A0A0C3QFY5_9AGAM|nr:hypothetical protein M407DRAFT_8592 [Tulasnella calospora MUT 4182]